MVKPNKDGGFRIPYYFCTRCQARREPENPGDVFPVCGHCGHRTLEVKFETEEPVKVREKDVPRDERPPEAEPRTQAPFTRRMKARRETTMDVLRFLVHDFEAGIDAPETWRALFGLFNPFLRGVVNHMVIERVDWRAAIEALSKDKIFCGRYAAQLEEFKRWAEDPESSAVPSFIEPEPPHSHDPLAEEPMEPQQTSTSQAPP